MCGQILGYFTLPYWPRNLRRSGHSVCVVDGWHFWGYVRMHFRTLHRTFFTRAAGIRADWMILSGPLIILVPCYYNDLQQPIYRKGSNNNHAQVKPGSAQNHDAWVTAFGQTSCTGWDCFCFSMRRVFCVCDYADMFQLLTVEIIAAGFQQKGLIAFENNDLKR